MVQTKANTGRQWGLIIIGVLMILFGIAEVATGFNHNFFGVTTQENSLSTTIGASLGLLYFIAGVLCFVRRPWAMWTAVICLALDVVGRLTMVFTGLFPVDSAKQIFSIIVGTGLAALFAIYIWWKRRYFATK